MGLGVDPMMLTEAEAGEVGRGNAGAHNELVATVWLLQHATILQETRQNGQNAPDEEIVGSIRRPPMSLNGPAATSLSPQIARTAKADR
jgi:hypothetical protein